MSTKLLTKTQNPYKTDVYTLYGILPKTIYKVDYPSWKPSTIVLVLVRFGEPLL